MLQTTVVSKALLRSLFSGDGAYQLAFSMLFGMSALPTSHPINVQSLMCAFIDVWNTFLAGNELVYFILK